MNVYYTNPQLSKLPYELQNEILSYLPPHPIKCILDKCIYKFNLDDFEYFEYFKDYMCYLIRKEKYNKAITNVNKAYQYYKPHQQYNECKICGESFIPLDTDLDTVISYCFECI